MKKAAFIIAFLISELCCHAQYNAQWQSGTSLDNGILAFRMTTMPDWRFHADDFLQYSPAAALIVLKACGVQGRSTWGSMMTSAAFATAVDVALVNGLKYTVCRTRPDGMADNSFPSGHTATSFMTATLLQKEFGWKYPWIGFGGYAVAAGVGFSRILNNRHWETDVIGGALVGIAAGELGYWLSSLIFKEKGFKDGFRAGPGWREKIADSEGRSLFSRMPYEVGVYFATAAGLWPADRQENGRQAGKRQASGRTALSTTGIGASLPFTKHLGAAVRLGICGETRTEAGSDAAGTDRSYRASHETLGGIYAGWDFYGLAFIRPHALAGAGYEKEGTASSDGVQVRFLCAAGVDLGLQITDNYAFKFTADYEWYRGRWSGIMLGGGAAFCF